MTEEWAGQLLALGYPTDLPLSFDRVTGAIGYTLGQLAAQGPGTYHETFHTAWNDCNRNGVYDAGVDMECAPSNQACATAQ